jgi:hypothetical protein
MTGRLRFYDRAVMRLKHPGVAGLHAATRAGLPWRVRERSSAKPLTGTRAALGEAQDRHRAELRGAAGDDPEVPGADREVGVILSGGNVDLNALPW